MSDDELVRAGIELMHRLPRKDMQIVQKLVGSLDQSNEFRRSTFTPPDGWFVFGTFAHPKFDGTGIKLEFWGDDGGGLPIWERPVKVIEVDE